MEFVKICGDSIIGIPLDASPDENSPPISDVILKIEKFMIKLGEMVDEFPPLKQPMRFGNKAFRDWFIRLAQEIPIFLKDILGSYYSTHGVEVATYLQTSFGNETRIDYGTGHELNYVLFLLCIFKLQLVSMTELKYFVLRGFGSYVHTMRRLQDTYILEPAGSHGVWGLDDFYCVVFVWGSAQLCGHPSLSPSSIHDNEIIEDESLIKQYLYLDSIRFIRHIKKGAPFSESSPMLNDISGLSDWKSVYRGLYRLFQGEVIQKFPVAQHIAFGQLIPCTWTPSSSFSDSSAQLASSPTHYRHMYTHTPAHATLGAPLASFAPVSPVSYMRPASDIDTVPDSNEGRVSAQPPVTGVRSEWATPAPWAQPGSTASQPSK
eukprot:CAMPEP_0182424880 /NCGR_PEP_ID=MMETSP1167-20130531/11147_1 /TAXON_ID=2988 /ORGANISM="Mallomonas Sp, Strain CCMP3275" /LENGTH=376 /DNA_ID=CAMNT_0024605031 /DNA_START=261 /DNA_END=1391 /DNA_ORIENTATION=+